VEDLLERLRPALAGRYTIDHEIGSGGMATVYLAQDLKHHRLVAIKVLKPELAASLGAERFLREIEISAQLNHPNILTLIDSGKADGLLYYAMPYVEGESLRDRLEREKQLPIEDALQITSEVADALSYAHSLGIVHRDVKPENILFAAGHAVVADFGIAKAVTEAGGEALTETGLAIGTPAYMSPEQAVGTKGLDTRSDVYSLGCVLYEMLSGDPPFVGSTPQAIIARKSAEAAPSLKVVRRRVTDSVEYAVATALETTPADRFATVSQFVEALRAPAPPRRASGPAPPSLSVVTGLYVAGSVLVLAAAYLLVQQLGLPYWVLTAAAVLVVMFLPLTLVTGTVERRRVSAAHANGWDTGSGSRPKTGLTWRRAGITMVLAFALLGLTAAGYSAMRSMGIGPAGTLVAAGILPERPRIIVADFENRTADGSLGITIAEMLRIDLAQSQVVRLPNNAAIAEALRWMDRDPEAPLDVSMALEIAEREGVPAVIAGAVSPMGDGYVLTVRLIAAADGAELIPLRETVRDPARPYDAIDRLSRALRTQIGEPLRSVRGSEPLVRATTSSIEALRKFTEGTRAYGRTGQYAGATALLEEAVVLDSGFAQAHLMLATWYYDREMYSQAREAARRAFEHRSRMPERRRAATEVNYYRLVEPDRAKLMEVYESTLSRYPRHATAMVMLADLYLKSRRWTEAERLALRAAAIVPFPNAFYNAIEAQVAQGRIGDAERTLLGLAEADPEHRYLLWLPVRFAEARRDYEGTGALLDSTRRDENVAWWLLGTARNRVVQGMFAEGLGYLSEWILIDNESHDIWGAAIHARVSVWSGDTTGALNRVEHALEGYRRDSLPDEALYLPLVTLYAETNQPERAREFLEAYQVQVHEVIQLRRPERHGAAGAIAFAEKNFQDAIQHYRRWYEESNCAVCGLYQLGRAYEMSGDVDSAVAVYQRAVDTPGLRRWVEEYLTLGPTYQRLATLYEQRGDRNNAIEYYNRFIELWKDADPELQPQVQHARERLAALVGEPQPAM
jgi:tetratricopeptide (TPR) repeat protein/tRNA A-37 threonylcarbamoyl transferase component Bud32